MLTQRFTDIEKREENLVRFSTIYNHSLGAGGKGMGTSLKLRNSDTEKTL